jgi:mannose-6-phosphate isomerase
MNHRGKIVLLPPNRVWRTYQGGAELDRLAASAPVPADTHFPEDWVASVTRARNAGREHLPHEGLSTVLVGGNAHSLDTLLASDPAYFLGPAHLARFGPVPQLLVKLLDSAIRLHFQVHPTADFARLRLGAPSGKTEAYHVLATRPGFDARLYLGFQRPPSRAELKRIILDQDIAALEACFDPIAVAPGDTFLVPGGTPHALGAGLLLVEIQEPSDLVVRFEFSRGGYVLPEAARFMGRDLDFCLDVFNFTPRPVERIARENHLAPRHLHDLGPGSWQEELIGPAHTPCFRLRRSHLSAPFEKTETEASVVIVTNGSCTLSAGGETHPLRFGDKAFLPAGLGPVAIQPALSGCTLLECLPPAP